MNLLLESLLHGVIHVGVILVALFLFSVVFNMCCHMILDACKRYYTFTKLFRSDDPLTQNTTTKESKV